MISRTHSKPPAYLWVIVHGCPRQSEEKFRTLELVPLVYNPLLANMAALIIYKRGGFLERRTPWNTYESILGEQQRTHACSEYEPPLQNASWQRRWCRAIFRVVLLFFLINGG